MNCVCSCDISNFRYPYESIEMDLKIIGMLLLTLECVQGQFFEDRRCRCVCPNPAAVLNTTSSRQIFTGNVPPRLCHCEGVVFPLLKAELEGKLHIFCPRCECIYQTRNTSLIMGIVFIILMGIFVSILYMMSFSGLKTWIMRGRNSRHLERPLERDYIREHRGEFQRERQRELERQLRQRELEEQLHSRELEQELRQRELEMEHRMQQQREREREREREHERNRHRNRAVRDGSPGSEEEELLRAEVPEY